MGICVSKPSTDPDNSIPPRHNTIPPQQNSVPHQHNTIPPQHNNTIPGKNSVEPGKKSPFLPFYSPSPAHFLFSKKSPAVGSPVTGSSNSTPRRLFPFPPPSPAKHIKAAWARRRGLVKPNESVSAIQENDEVDGGARLDKSFGFSKNFGSTFEIGDEVGRGHFGYTCRAKFKKGEFKGLDVAVKVIPKAKMTTSIAIEDVRREVKILRALTGHNNLVQFYDAYEDHANVYVVMELCEGGELLDRILARGGKYTEDDAKAVMIQILNVVAFCHLQGVVHRDLKPENFLFKSKDEDSQLKAIDFGLSDYVKTGHSWIRDSNDIKFPLDILVFKLMKVYMCSSPLRKAALRALSKTLTVDELFYLKEQFVLLEPNKNGSISLENIKQALMRNSTDAMKDSRVHDLLISLNALQYRRMDFEEFCAAALSVHQLEALDRWEQHARCAYELFEKDGNRAIMIEELASELGLGPSIPVHAVLHDWIRHTDGKLSFLGYVKLLHGASTRAIAKAR
ncbi:CDPK-related protein kinase isoform X2 [Apium graveolens]|uniref:CDPK-related protein kinase isoform X2 n=1 Tax=Apium graveolens TaxID=4045 RepID=UPI003D7A476D